MAVVRFIQGLFMMYDIEMYYEKADLRAAVRNMLLNEEIGQISHIFSDKTGTLTSNNMDYRKSSINGIAYGEGITEIGRAAWKLLGKNIPVEMLDGEEKAQSVNYDHVSFYDRHFDNDISVNDDDTSVYENHPLHSLYSESEDDAFVKRNEQKVAINNFYRYLAICHEVIVEHWDGKSRLSAPNPDDEALVCAAAFFGYSFKDRVDDLLIIENTNYRPPKSNNIINKSSNDSEANKLEIHTLCVIPFSSKRKCMSVIFRDIDGKIKLVMKGADTKVFSRSVESMRSNIVKRKTREDLEKFSAEGLRCLVVAAKVINDEEFQSWNEKYMNASSNLEEIEKKKREEINLIETLEDEIETSVEIIGATAIEDKLQVGVPEAISKLVAAGINISILTGDKEETAINIGVACNLIQPPQYMDQLIINEKNATSFDRAIEVMKVEIENIKRKNILKRQTSNENPAEVSKWHRSPMLKKTLSVFQSRSRSNSNDMMDNEVEATRQTALIIDGPSLLLIQADEDSKKLLLELFTLCAAVICCRVSPDQKREVVDLVKENIKSIQTLAIGDGANDVAMIKAAHVGVGIKGEEGVQAVNSSDYAIAQFRYLCPLLLKHGHYNYVRMSGLVNFMFYKNILLSLSLFWFSTFDAWSETKIFTEGRYSLNLLYYYLIQ